MNDIRFYINDDHTLKGAVEGFMSAYGNGSNTVTMVAPFLTTHTEYVLYRKPNGIAAERYVMIPTGETETVNVAGNNEEWNIWINYVPGAVVNIDSADAQNLAVGFEDWYFVPEAGFLGIVQFEVDLLTTFTGAVEGDFARVVDTNTDWQYLSGVWVDSTTQLVGEESRERVEMVGVAVDPNIDGGLPTVAPDNTEIIITILNNKLSISDAIDTYVARDVETAYAQAVTIALTDKIHIQTATGSKYATMSQVVAGAGGMAETDYDTPDAGVTKSVKYARNMRTSTGVDESTALEVKTTVDRVNQALLTTSSPTFVGVTTKIVTLYNSAGTEAATIDFANGDMRLSYNGITKEYGKNLFVGIKARTIIGEGVVIQYDGAVGGGSTKIWAKIADKNEINVAPYLILGVTTTTLTASEEQDINYYGAINEIDTTNYDGNSGTSADEGQILYYDSVNGLGGLTLTEPEAPNVQIKMAVISSYHATQGQIKVRPHIGLFLADLHDVYLNGGVSDGDIIKYNTLNSRWEAFALDTALEARLFPKTGFDLDVMTFVSIAMVNATRTFTLAKTGDVVEYWQENVKYILDADKTVVIDDVEGQWFIYLNGATLIASQTVWDLRADNRPPVAVVNWDATNKVATAVAYEIHSWKMSGIDHFDSHFGLKTLYISGLGLSDTGNDTLTLTNGVIADEDILISIVNSASPSSYWEQKLSPDIQSYKYYRDGANGDLRRADDSTSPFYVVGNKVQLNPFSGGVWGLTDMTVNKFGAYWVIMTSDITNPVKFFLGQEEADSLNNAIEDNTITGLDLGTIPFEEILVAYRVIVQQINTAPYYHIEQIDNMIVNPVTGDPVDLVNSHGALLGLADDDHLQYYNLTRIDLWKISNIDPDLLLKIDKDYEAYTEMLSGGIVTGDIILVRDISTGETKKMTVNEFKSWLALTGDIFDPTVNYMAEGLGAYKTAMQTYFTLTLDTLGKYKTAIRTQLTDQILYVQMPTITSNTNTLKISTDDGVTYYDVLVNGSTVYAQTVSDKLLKLQFDGTNFIVDLQSLAQQITFDSVINSTYGTVAPIKGIPEFNNAYGLSLNQPVDGSCTTLSSWIPTFSVDTVSSGIITNTGNGGSDLSYTTNETDLALSGVDDVFVKLRARVKNSVALLLYLQVRDSVTGTIQNIQVLTPIQDKWYDIDLSDIVDVSGASNNLTIRALHTYADAGTQNGKVMEIDYVMAIPITNTPVASKTASELNNIVKEYFEDYTYITNFELYVNGVNGFDYQQAFEQGGFLGDGSEASTNIRIRNVNFVPIKPSTTYYYNETITVDSTLIGISVINYYDGSNNFISQDVVESASASFTSPSNATQIRFTLRKMDNATLEPSILTNNSLDIQLEEGSSFTTYAIFNSPQDNFKLLCDLLSVGTSVRDRAYPLNGAYWKDKYVEIHTLVDADFVGLADAGTNNDRVRINKPLDSETYGNGVQYTDTFNLDYPDFFPLSSYADDTASIGGYYVYSSTAFELVVAKGTYADLAAAKADLIGNIYYYVLEDYTTEEIEKNGSLIQEENTTLVQVGNFATEYDITFALDSNKQLLILNDKITYILGEIDDLEDDIEALDVRVTDNEADILALQGLGNITLLETYEYTGATAQPLQTDAGAYAQLLNYPLCVAIVSSVNTQIDDTAADGVFMSGSVLFKPSDLYSVDDVGEWIDSNEVYWDDNGDIGGTYDVTGGATETDSSYLPTPDALAFGIAGRVTALDLSEDWFVTSGKYKVSGGVAIYLETANLTGAANPASIAFARAILNRSESDLKYALPGYNVAGQKIVMKIYGITL